MSIYTERTLPPVDTENAENTSIGRIAATSAKSQDVLHLPQTGSGPSSPRSARSPLGKSVAANQNAYSGESPSGKHTFHASPIRRNMSVFAQTPPPPRSPRTPRKLNSVQAERSPFLTKDSVSSTVSSTELSFHKQCADLHAQLASVTADYGHIEEELSRKSMRVDELTQKMVHSEKLIRSMEDERQQTADLHKRELQYYQESVEELSRQKMRIAQRLEAEQAANERIALDQEEKYSKLCKSYKALQSNFELEQNSKALLIDQIEYLSKERDILLENTGPQLSVADLDRDLDKVTESDFVLQNSDDDLHSHLDSNSDSDIHPCSGSESDSEGSVHGTQLLSSYAELTSPDLGFDASSPIKDHEQNFLDLSPDFQFPAPNPIDSAPALAKPDGTPVQFSPPTSEESATSLKRQSLPAQLKLNSSFDDDFVLSPLKLTTHANTSYFDADSSVPSTSTRPNPIVKKRYSEARANHSRYNSHDIVPIKVEFESPKEQLRSSSAPDKDHISQQLSSVAEGNPIQDSDMAFMKLNGYPVSSKRDSLMTNSSKRSSFISEFNMSSGDITKQEITKLKFELQSLKLHNEKLLSYIGFELQKQKKNIKKLSSKQNLRPKKMTHNHNFEYSDAKLIEKSKEMLIHKKRVLRSVSINPVLSTKCSGNRSSSFFSPLVGLGMSHNNPTEDEEDFVFRSHFINSLNTDDRDNDGFIEHNGRYNSRLSSKSNHEFSDQTDQHTIKKYRSQTFGPPSHQTILDLSSAEESFMSIDEEEELANIDEGYSTTHESNGEWESSSEKSVMSDIDYDKLNCFNQMKYLILGKEHLQKKRRVEPMVDENLKYKFFTIAIGIVIVGIKLTSHPHQHLTSN